MVPSDPTTSSDAHLLSAFRAGETRAFADLVERYQGALLRHARMLLGDRGAAEDAVQEAFLTLAKSPPEPLQQGELIGAWLHTVTRNHCLDAMRSETRRRDRISALRAETPVATLDPALGAVDATDTRSAVERTLRSLPEDQREVVTLRLIEEKSYAEIAAITGRKVGTVGWLISVGMRALARELGPLLDRPLEA